MKYIPTLTIDSTIQLHSLTLQRGQWIKFAWCDQRSRFHSANERYVTAFHFPKAVSAFNSYCAAIKGAK
jgi:hypothetical protein